MEVAGLGILAVVGVIALILFFLIIFITRSYHRVPPSEVLVVYGGRRRRLVTNGGVFVIPVIETYKKLDITIMTIKTEKDEVYTQSGVPIRLDWVAQVQIDPEEAALQTAARAFLDKTREEVRDIITETLSANFRAIVGQMSVEAIHRDRDDFVQKVQDLASDDVAAMGVKVISMGIEEITDDQGYLQAMAAPQIAAVKRDATIAEAEADREARVRAALAQREAEQAELDAQREILAQREALQIREVQVNKTVGLAQAEADQEVQQRRALAVAQQQEAEILVPARSQREATEINAEAARRRVEIEAEAERNRVTITAEAEAQATRQRAEAQAAATEKTGLAEAAALRARKEAEAAGEKANLLAEAEGRRELAAASAAEGEINLRQYIVEQITRAEIAKAEAIARALAGLGNNVRVVQFGNGSGHNNGASSTGNTFMDMLLNIPEVAEIFRSKVEALSNEDLESTIRKVAQLFNSLKQVDMPDQTPADGTNLLAVDEPRA